VFVTVRPAAFTSSFVDPCCERALNTSTTRRPRSRDADVDVQSAIGAHVHGADRCCFANSVAMIKRERAFGRIRPRPNCRPMIIAAAWGMTVCEERSCE
jgi:hypothetical protein